MQIIPQVLPRSINNQTTIQRIGNKAGELTPNFISKHFEMNRIGQLGRWSLLAVGLIFVLGVRWYKSRDAHEKREVLTRDGVTVVSAMLAVPFVKKWMQIGLDKITKIPALSESFDNLEKMYSKANIMPEKVLTMAKNIVDKKGDLAKAFGTLGDEGMKHVKTMLNGKEISSDNILQALKEAFNSSDRAIKEAFEELTTVLSKPNNNLVKTVQRYKAIPNLASLAFVTALLGWGIPAFNIKFTRKKLKAKSHEQPDKQVMVKLEPQLNASQQNIVQAFFSQNK